MVQCLFKTLQFLVSLISIIKLFLNISLILYILKMDISLEGKKVNFTDTFELNQ